MSLLKEKTSDKHVRRIENKFYIAAETKKKVD